MYRKKMLVGLLVSVTAIPASWALDAESLKKQALAACDTSIQQMPEEHRDLALKTCKCSVNKTDYSLVLSGDTAKIQEQAMKVAQECAKEAGADMTKK